MLSAQFLSFCVCACLSIFIFVIFYLEYKIASRIISFASQRNAVLCVILLVLASILSPIALLVACIRNISLINKAIITIFLVVSIILGFNVFNIVYNNISSQITVNKNNQIQNNCDVDFKKQYYTVSALFK